LETKVSRVTLVQLVEQVILVLRVMMETKDHKVVRVLSDLKVAKDL
jgi:hypothetical protein